VGPAAAERRSAAIEELFPVFSTGVRLRLARQLGVGDLNDRVHDLFVVVTESIRNGNYGSRSG
jgi:hypothetical protein